MANFRLKTVRGKQVKQLVGSSRTKLVDRLRRLKANNPFIEDEVNQFREIYARHKAYVNDPNNAGTLAHKQSKANLPHGRAVVRKSERKLRQIKRLQTFVK